MLFGSHTLHTSDMSLALQQTSCWSFSARRMARTGPTRVNTHMRGTGGLVEWYIENVKEYAEKYLESPAGRKMKAAVMKGRRYSKALPTVETDTLRLFDGAEGIAWGIAEVCDFFYILSEVTQFEDMSVEVHNKQLN